ncbi:MAG: HD domain-containing protein [Candidatus Woesearchaeota archaeon]|nr:MAG: HD domain-containing protein [Candidatus Woesearchaeota archaeon]
MIKSRGGITKDHFEEAKEFAYGFLDRLDKGYFYHGKHHTEKFVLPYTLKIAKKEGFSEEEQYLVGIAALFHDTGFVKRYNKNEPIGAKFAEEYMKKSKFIYTGRHVKLVKKAIFNTNMKGEPPSEYAKVLRDADLIYLGFSFRKFMKVMEDLRREALYHKDSYYHKFAKRKKEWYRNSIKFLKSQRWFTSYSKKMFGKSKERNLVKLRKLAYS